MTKDEQIAITKYDLLYEQRMTRVETTLTNMDETLKDVKTEMRAMRSEFKTDFRWLAGIMLAGFGLTLGGFGALFGLMAHGFKWF